MRRFSLFLLLLCLTGGDLAARSLTTRYRVTTAGNRTSCPVVLRDVPTWARSVRVLAEGAEIPSQLDRPLGEAASAALQDHQRPDDVAGAAGLCRYHKLHHHGPAFESEYAAYRIYFDKKQTIDTYGKKLPRLELAGTMWYPSDAQMAADYGYDNLRVFGSVGVGALKGWDAEKRKMTHITDFARREARILAKGPVRTVVEMRVEGWRYGGREIAMTSRYILYAGHSDVRVENRIEGDFSGLLFTTGVMKMAENEVRRTETAIAAVGCDFPENDTLKWERERVGLSIAVPADRIVSRIDDRTSYLFQLAPDAEGRIDYVFDMWWRRSSWLKEIPDGEFPERMLERLDAEAPEAEVRRLK